VLTPENSASWQALLAQPCQVVVTTHFKPDGDAMGSMLGFGAYLCKKGFDVQLIAPSDWPDFLNFLPGYEKVLNYETATRTAWKFLREAQIVFCLDFNDLDRVHGMREDIEKSGARLVMIDHHLHPKDFASLALSNTQAAATCELVAQLIREVGDWHLVDIEMAICLYTGIMTDTGSFRFSSTSANLHRLVADLMDLGLQPTPLHEAIDDHFTENKLRFLGHCYHHCLRLIPESKTAYFLLATDDLKAFSTATGDTESLVNTALGIQGVRFAALITEREDRIKMSFRSKGKIPANEFASLFFEGGGHFNAAGGKSRDSLAETEARFLSHLNFINQHL
jgi:phosphoesterase RecJ-like protein